MSASGPRGVFIVEGFDLVRNSSNLVKLGEDPSFFGGLVKCGYIRWNVVVRAKMGFTSLGVRSNGVVRTRFILGKDIFAFGFTILFYSEESRMVNRD